MGCSAYFTSRRRRAARPASALPSRASVIPPSGTEDEFKVPPTEKNPYSPSIASFKSAKAAAFSVRHKQMVDELNAGNTGQQQADQAENASRLAATGEKQAETQRGMLGVAQRQASTSEAQLRHSQNQMLAPTLMFRTGPNGENIPHIVGTVFDRTTGIPKVVEVPIPNGAGLFSLNNF